MARLRGNASTERNKGERTCLELLCVSTGLSLLIFVAGFALTSAIYGAGIEEKTWIQRIKSLFWEQEDPDTVSSYIRKTASTILYHITSTFYQSIQHIHDQPGKLDPGRHSVQVLLMIFLLTLSLLWLCSYIRSYSSDLHHGDDQFLSLQISRTWILFQKYLMTLMILALLVSIPWEYIRLYQNEVSRKAAISIQGMPEDCQPNKMSFWGALRSWFMRHFSWSENPCEQYHKAILVDPFWEISPLLVLSSLFTRCITQPLETIGINLGLSLRAFFSHVPAQWQPVILIIMSSLAIITLVMVCGYHVSVPLFISIRPGDVNNPKSKRRRLNTIKGPGSLSGNGSPQKSL